MPLGLAYRLRHRARVRRVGPLHDTMPPIVCGAQKRDAGHGEAGQRWANAEAADPETPFMAYQAPALPAWSAQAPAHVTRELLGRFLQDRNTRTVHDVYRATAECAVDAIRNGTFFHFWSEVVGDSSVANDLPCPHCIAL